MNMTQKKIGLALSALVFSSVSLSVLAETESAVVANMPDVTVSASKGSRFENMDVSTTVMTREQVQQAPETTIDQIINKIPGVFTLQQPAAQLHPTSQVFSIRGFGTTTNVNTLVMVDGIPANDAYFRTVDWAQVPKDTIERIEVIRGGGATSLWGNMAMGGIVNIVTREPVADEKRVHASYGSFNTYTVDAGATLLANESVKIGINYDGMKTDGYNQTPSRYRNPYMSSTQSRTDNLLVSAYFTPSVSSKYYAKLLVHQIQEENLIWNNTKNTWDNYKLSGGGTTKFENGSSINLSAWYANSEMDTQNASQSPAYNRLTPTLAVPYVSQKEAAKYYNYGGSAFYQHDFGHFYDVKVGVDGRLISADDDLNLFIASGYAGNLVAKGEHRFQGIFAQATYRPESIPLDITLGLRQDFWQARQGSLNGIYRGALIANDLADQTYTRFDPRLGFKYYFENGFDIRAAAYRNFAAPGMNQMYRSFISGTSFTTANPDLKPQTNTGKEIGIDYVHGGVNLALTAFYNELDGFIDLPTVQSGCAAGNNYCGTGISTINGGTLRQYVNAGNAVFKGVELLGQWQASETLALNASYTRTSAYLTHSDYTTPSSGVIPDPVGVQIGQVPRWLAMAGASWVAMPGLTLTVQLKRFPDYWNNTSHTQLNEQATLADVGMSYKINKTAEIYGIAQNIGNKKYYDQGYTYTTTNGSTINSSSIPALGMPFNLTMGVKMIF
jgi:outer membrane receptor protein involved in Fe transport